MSDADDRRKRGLDTMKQVTGFALEPQDPFQSFTVDAVFGDVWSRPGLTRKERRWITLTLAARSGQATAYGAHLRGALNSGDISQEELMEWVVQLAHYAGWPTAAGVYGEMLKVFGEQAAAD